MNASLVSDNLPGTAISSAIAPEEPFYRLLFEATNDAVLLFDPETEEIFDANQPAAALYGVERKHLIGRYLTEFTENVERGRERIEEALRDGAIFNLETTHLRADGTKICVGVHAFLTTFQGRPAILSINRDITADARERKARLATQDLFNAFVHRSPVISFVKDESGRYFFMSEAVERLLGYPVEHFRGDTQETWQSPDVEKGFQDSDRKVLASGRPEEFVENVPALDGTVKPLLVLKFPLTDPNGNRLIGGIAMDISDRIAAEEKLRLAKEFSENLVETAPVIIAQLDRHGRIKVMNRVAEEVTGYTRAELERKDWLRLVLPRKQYGPVWDAFRMSAMRGVPAPFEAPLLTRSGEERTIAWNYSQVRENGRVVGLIACGTDITEAREAQSVLHRYQLLLEHASDIMVLLRPDGRILEANKAASRVSGYSREELLTMSMADLRARGTARSVSTEVRQALVGTGLFEMCLRRKDGSTFTAEVSSQAARIGSERVLLCVIRDITERKALERELAHQAFHDPLTGLPNRALFLDRTMHALASNARRNETVAVLFVDVDQFKSINDTLGHEAGDRLLVAVAGRLCASLRGGDTAARFGGDEFTVLLENLATEAEAIQVAERILRRFKEPFDVGGREVFVTASIGITISQTPLDTPDLLLKEADTAMYQVKQQGRANYAVFHRAAKPAANDRKDLQADLHRAIERNEFHVQYQPVVEMQTGRIVAVEALVRWQHPRYGLIPPDEFVPLQEQIGLAEQLTFWVLDEARRQCARWHAAGRPLAVSVNISPRHVHDDDFPSRLKTVLEREGPGPGWLQLEINEHAILTNPQRAMGILRQISALGVRLCLDDFSANVSLAVLKVVPAAEIKVHRSFLRDVMDGTEDVPILRAAINLAHTLGKQVVVKGVEDQAGWDLLRSLACDGAQGYYIGRPMTAEQLDGFFESSPFGKPV